MTANLTKRHNSTGYMIRDKKSNVFPSASRGETFSSVKLPDGKTMKMVDRSLFDRALTAAVRKMK